MTWTKTAAVAVFGFILGTGVMHTVKADDNDQKMMGHAVFFTLKDGSKENVAKCIDACKKYLVKHEGIVFFACGSRATEFSREVNDQEFHVSLHLVFKNKAAHDKYQDHPEHKKFIDECKDLWAKVRVFDDFLDSVEIPKARP
jgi:quinol monooxygenase YgiN